MFFTNHLYFFWSVFIFITLWVPLFVFNKPGRKWMLFMSLLGVLLGMPFIQNMYITDWWHPHFIFEFPIKIEDMLFGLGTVGVISSLYSLLKARDIKRIGIRFSFTYKVVAIVSAFSIMLGSFYVFHIHSLLASILGGSAGVIFIAVKRPFFLRHAALTGLFVSLYFLPMYLMALFINPGFINNEWFVHQLSGITLLSVPIEEFIWYFFAAFSLSGLQELLE